AAAQSRRATERRTRRARQRTRTTRPGTGSLTGQLSGEWKRPGTGDLRRPDQEPVKEETLT
ncbi:MAG TPA: hypothetical protein VJT82_02550, partial [Pyrinomonadaceae bacterium]|nr:hypothetical protein [Pyrinomonadaceae bacterium]